jgi:phosphoribosyl 1,2-cyclic phosphodiesterase
MKVKILASGSKGNCVAILSGDSCILIDAGLPKTHIEKRLSENGINPTSIKAIFVSHAHTDHICGLQLANKYKIPVFATEGEWKKIDGVDDDLMNVLLKRDGKYNTVLSDGCDFVVNPFQIHHDAMEPVGYSIETDEVGGRCCVVFDTGHVDDYMLEMMEGHIYVIEANHDVDMLTNGKYNDFLKSRILSDVGHLSNLQCADALAKLIKGKGERIYITHLSKNNNTPELAEQAVEGALEAKGLERLFDYQLEVVR